jgi:DNA-binding NarL/FixJ family response regulator
MTHSHEITHVALVDDDDDVRDAYVTIINSSNLFECKGFRNAEEFLTLGLKQNFHVVIMDVGLPGQSGIECTRAVKSSSPNTLVMMFTVYENNENIFKALEAGASGYLVKQSSPDFILNAISELRGGGAPMSSQIARKVLDFFRSAGEPKTNDFGLSEREKQILELLAEGHRYQDIADKLFISFGTVRTYIYHIYNKLHVDNRTSAINKWNSRD